MDPQLIDLILRYGFILFIALCVLAIASTGIKGH